MADPTRPHPEHSFPTGDRRPATDTRGVGEPTHEPSGSSAEPAPAHLPSTPPGFELLSEVGRGGMGVVYRARDTALGRDVAVKLLQDRFPLASLAARRFVDEARITGQLQHPGIPPIHEVGELPNGRPYLVMKLIKGRTLAELIAGGTQRRGPLVAVFEQVCQAVAYAHNHGVVHRDLKPSNVMVGAFGEVHVMDWGLAKFRAETRADSSEATVASTFHDPRTEADEDLHTRAGSFLGTPAYMSPEQAIGAVDQIDERSDVFGLGGILCAIMTGEPPFVAATAESTRQLAAQKQLAPAFERLNGCRAEPELVALCKRCLAGDRDARPRNAGEVAGAVHTIRAAVEERARQAELEAVRLEGEKAAADLRVAEQRRRSRLRLALATAVGLMTLAGGAFAWYWDRQAAAREREQAAARDAARQNLEAALDRAAAALREDRLPVASAALDRAAELLDPADAPNLRERYSGLRADLALVSELDRVWTRSSAVLAEQAPGQVRRVTDGLRFDDAAAQMGYPAAFAVRGLAVETADPSGLADQVARSPVRDRLVGALDDWLPFARAEDRPRLCELLARIDPNPARTAVRRAHLDPASLSAVLAGAPDEALRVAARAARTVTGADARVRTVLEAAAARHPDDFRVQYAAGVAALRHAPAEAVGYLRAAAALRPDNLAAVYTLGSVLYPIPSRINEGAAYLLRAAEIDPGFVSSYLALSDAIKLGANPAPAVAHFEREVARDANNPLAHFGLGMALRDRDPKRARAAFERSIALDGRSAAAHLYLGYVLDRTNDIDLRIECFRKAIELDPTFSFPHTDLARSLRAKGDLTGAEAEYRAALKLFPEHTFSHAELGNLLYQSGRPEEAVEHWRAAIRSNPSFFSTYYPLGQYLLRSGKPAEAAEVFRACVAQFPGEYVGYDGLILALAHQGQHAAAVGVYEAVALRGFPKWWSADVLQRLRYNAACSAALAGVGLGRDAPPAADRMVFRWQSLAWLRAELALRRQMASVTAAEQKKAVDSLSWWLRDPDLACVRPGLMRIGLASGERAEWDALWADVREVLAGVGKSDLPPELAPPPRPVGGR